MNLSELELRSLIKESLIVESSKKKFNKLIEQGKVPEEDFSQMWNGKRNKFNPPFNDDLYRMIVYNTYNAEQNHSVEDFKNNYEYIKQKVLSPFASGGRALAPVTVPGIGIFDVSKSLNDKTTTYDEIMEYAEYKDSVTVKKSNVLQDIIDDAVAGKSNQHLELIYKDDSWIFLYPKSYKGSIAVSRMGGDLKYYGNATSQNSSIGRIPWCIAPDSAGNMFLNYHRRMNLHMYIGTKLGNRYKNNDNNRKVCLSFLKKHGYVDLAKGNSTVNARNKDLPKSEVMSIVGSGIFSALEKDAKRPERLEIDEISYYKSVNFAQFQNIEAAIDTNSQTDYERFLKETESIGQYTESAELLKYIYLKFGSKNNETKYVDDDFNVFTVSSLALSGIEENPLFNASFLKSLNVDPSSLPPRHGMILDSRLVESVCTNAMNSLRFTWQDRDSDAKATLVTLSKMQISTMSQKFQDKLAFTLIKMLESKNDYIYSNLVLDFMSVDKTFADLVFGKLGKEKIRALIDKGSFLKNHPLVFGMIYNNTQEVYSDYRIAVKKGLAKFRKRAPSQDRVQDNPRFSATPSSFIPPEEIVKIIDNEQGYSDGFIVSCMKQYIGFNHGGIIKLSDQEAGYVKNKILEFYYSKGKNTKKAILKQIHADNLLGTDSDEIGKLIYELYKNNAKEYPKFGKTSYDDKVLHHALDDKNIVFIEAYLPVLNRHFLQGLNEDENVTRKILELGDSKHLIIGKLAAASFYQKAENFNSDLSLATMEKILSGDDYDSSLIYALVSSPAVLESQMYDNTVYKILNEKDQTKKEMLLYVISTSARRFSLTKAQSTNVASAVFDNLDTFYNDKQMASDSVSSIFKFLTNDQKLKMLYKDDGDLTMNVVIRSSASTELIISMKGFYYDLVSIGYEYNEGFGEADLINFDQYLKYLLLTIGVKQSDIPEVLEVDNRLEFVNSAISKVITGKKYYDEQAQAVDMNRNKKMFEMYFNLSSTVTSRASNHDDNIPADGDYAQIANYFETLFK
jgi:hypothetical protein